VTAIDGDTSKAKAVCVLEVVHIDIQTVVMETMKHEVLSVSKSVVRYQKYVHMKDCLARRYIPIAWGQVRMTLIPAPGKAKCTMANGYHPINLLFFMQEIMQKLVARHIRGKSLDLCPLHLYQSAYKPGKSIETAMHPMITHTQEALENR